MIITALLVLIFAVYSVTNFKDATFENEFVLYDTATVTRIFMVDKQNNSVELNKKGADWYLPENQKAINENVVEILKTLMQIEIKYEIPKSARKSTIKRLAGNNTKVEIYQNEPLFTVFGIDFFTKQRLTKVFFVGGPTMDSKGTLMKMDKSDKIYITFIPGFNGYLSERFSAKIADWKSHEIFNYTISQIGKVKVEFPETPSESYLIENINNTSFRLSSLMDNMPVNNYDTIRLLELLVSFNKVNYEAYLDNLPAERIDSLLKTSPFKIVTVTNKMGESKVLRLYRRFNIDAILDMNGEYFPYDVDRMYGFVSGIKAPVSVQYFVADNFTRTLGFLKGEEVKNLNLSTEKSIVNPF